MALPIIIFRRCAKGEKACAKVGGGKLHCNNATWHSSHVSTSNYQPSSASASSGGYRATVHLHVPRVQPRSSRYVPKYYMQAVRRIANKPEVRDAA